MATASTTSSSSRSISPPRQTRIVTIAYGEQAAIQRLRGKYPARTAMKFATRYEGLGWESEEIAWRIYFDKRNAIDLYGKRRPGLYLDLFAAPEYVYHLESPMGRDIFKVDPTLGVGSVAAIVNGKAHARGGCRRAQVARARHRARALHRRVRIQGLEDRRQDHRSGQPLHPVGRRAWLRSPHHRQRRHGPRTGRGAS